MIDGFNHKDEESGITTQWCNVKDNINDTTRYAGFHDNMQHRPSEYVLFLVDI